MKHLLLISFAAICSCSNVKAQDSCTFKEIITQLKPSKYAMSGGAYGWSFDDGEKHCLTYYLSTDELVIKDSLCAIKQLIKTHEKDQKRILELYDEINKRQNLLNRAINQIDIANDIVLELIKKIK